MTFAGVPMWSEKCRWRPYYGYVARFEIDEIGPNGTPNKVFFLYLGQSS